MLVRKEGSSEVQHAAVWSLPSVQHGSALNASFCETEVTHAPRRRKPVPPKAAAVGELHDPVHEQIPGGEAAAARSHERSANRVATEVAEAPQRQAKRVDRPTPRPSSRETGARARTSEDVARLQRMVEAEAFFEGWFRRSLDDFEALSAPEPAAQPT